MTDLFSGSAWASLRMAGLLWALAFGVQAVRYLLMAGAVAALVETLPRRWRLALRTRPVSDSQQAMEFWSSLEAAAVLAAFVPPLAYAIGAGWTRVYSELGQWGAWYEPLSFLLVLILHDTYFYWTHRLMHHPRAFRRVHAHHHRSSAPSPWCAFSFHPLESLLSGAIYLLLPLVLPLHFAVMGAFLAWASLYSAMIHSGHDLFLARRSPGRRLHGRVLSTTLEHELHHAGVRGNYALYFSWWDRIMGTHVDPVEGAMAGE